MALHPIIERVIKRAYRRGHGNLHLQSVEQVRAYYYRHPIKQLTNEYEDHLLATGAFIRIHRPRWQPWRSSYPLVIYLRATSFVLGGVNDSNYFCHALSKHLNCMVAVIEPRLSPEYQFPIPLEDCIHAIEYLHQTHAKLKINPRKIMIWGESSGANFAAAITHHFSKEKERLIHHQVLIYPSLDYNHHYPSKELYGKGYLLDTSFLYWSVEQYTTDISQYEDERVSPLLASTFSHLPPTMIVGAQYDPLRDEQEAYINELLKSKVSVKAFFLPGMVHGFIWYARKIKEAREACLYASSFVKECFKQQSG